MLPPSLEGDRIMKLGKKFKWERRGVEGKGEGRGEEMEGKERLWS